MATTIQRSAAPVSEASVTEFERLIGCPLPADHRKFLLAHNGGKPRKTRFSYTNAKGQKKPARVAWFHSLGREQLDEPDRLDLEAAHAGRPNNFPAGVCIVGEAETDLNSGSIGLVCQGSDAGQVVFCTEGKNEKYAVRAVAPNWASFLESLSYDEKPKEWNEHIWNRDEAQFREWAKAKRRRWKDDVMLEQDVLRALVEENFWPGIAVMLELGSDRNDIFREAINQNRFTLAGNLLDAGSVQASAIQDALVGNSVLLMHQPALVERFLSVDGVDIDAQSDTGDSALHKAVEFRGEAVVDLLLARGANPTLVNDDDRTPAAIARRLEETQLLSVLLDAEKTWLTKNEDAGGVKPFDLAGVSIQRAGKPLTLEAIREFEKAVKLEFPPEYRWFLLQHNGGTPNPRVLPISPMHGQEDEEEEEDRSEDDPGYQPTVQFHPLRTADMPPPDSASPADDEDDMGGYSVEEASGWYHDGSEIPRGMVPIGSLNNFGCDGHGFLLLSCTGKKKGKLYTFDHGAAALKIDLPGLFAMLAEEGRKPVPPTDRFADAVAARDLEAVLAVLAEPGAKINWCSRDGRLPIRTACESKFDEAILAVARAKAHAIDQLVTEAATADRLQLVRDLLALGQKLKAETRKELTCYPALYRDARLLPSLLGEEKFQKMATRKRSYELLFSAVRSGSTEAVQSLLGRGIDINVVDEQGQTVLHQLFWGSMGDPAEMIPFLIGQGAKVCQGDCNGQTALHLAMLSGNAVAAKLLIDAGEDFHARYECYPEGSPADREKAARTAARMAKSIEREFEKLADDLDELDGDDQPEIDTSEIAGEKAERALEALGDLRQGLGQLQGALGNKVSEKLDELSRGSWGRGASALDAARVRPDLPEGFVAEIEAYAKKK